MAYFSNSTDGDSFIRAVCSKCVHWKDVGDGRGVGCPIMDLHLAWNGADVNQTAAKGTPEYIKGSMLRYFIVDNWRGLNPVQDTEKICSMFHAKIIV